MTRRFSRQDQLAAMRTRSMGSRGFQGSEPHRVSESTNWSARWQLRLRTNDRITHAAWPEFRSRDDNDANTVCGLRLHHCNLSTCRHPDRHKTKTFSARRSDDELVDCMTCLTRQVRQEGT